MVQPLPPARFIRQGIETHIPDKITPKEQKIVDEVEGKTPEDYLEDMRLSFNLPPYTVEKILDSAKRAFLLLGKDEDVKKAWDEAVQNGVGIDTQSKNIIQVNGGTLSLMNYLDNAKKFYSHQPFFYDKSGLFWFWQKELKKWVQVDDTDLLNAFDKILETGGQTIASNIKNNYLEAFRRYGRMNIPPDAPLNLIQFKDTVFDLDTKAVTPATPDYFFCNPIPWELGTHADTPTVDRLFEEWAGKEYVQTLHEILAYSCYRGYPIHLLFCLYGMGRNGKSCFLNLVNTFIGQDNTSSTDLDLLTGPQSSRFETIKLFKKLICLLGETNLGTLSRSSFLKKLTGGDAIGFEVKNKTPFTDFSYAKIIIASNSLPLTDDTSEGFYRRWLIIDFPNKFPEGKSVLESIPEEEYCALAKKVSMILPDLIERGTFTHQGSIEERQKKYIMSSNPLPTFVSTYCTEDPEGAILYSVFFAQYVNYLKKEKRRVISKKEFSMVINQEGYEVRRTSKEINGEHQNGVFVEGLRLKEHIQDYVDTSPEPSVALAVLGLVKEGEKSVEEIEQAVFPGKPWAVDPVLADMVKKGDLFKVKNGKYKGV